MSEPPRSPNSDQDLPDELGSVLLRFVDEGVDEARLRELCTAHPDQAARIRRFVATARRMGTPLLPDTELKEFNPSGSETDERRTIDHYQVVREVGRGGQGAVYLANDLNLGRQVALKVLRIDPAFARDALQRLRREIEILSMLEHPAICQIYDADTSGSQSYIAMRYVDGEPLSRRVTIAQKSGARCITTSPSTESEVPSRSDPSSVQGSTSSSKAGLLQVVHLIEKIARALHAAHEAGVVHRDVKPGNVMVTTEGEPIVLDFGLAANLHDESGQQLTDTGACIGTPAYMSPEQLTGQRIHMDRRTDVYSLGVTAYECLTLHLPYDSPTRDMLFQAILSKPPTDPRRYNRSIPRDLKVVLETALEKDRDRRYESALAFAEDLERVRCYLPIQARPVGTAVRFARWVQRFPMLASAVMASFVFLVAGLAVSLWLLSAVQAERAVVTQSLTTARALGLATAAADAMAFDPMRGLLLAREAVNTQHRPATVSQLHAAAAGLHQSRQLRGHGDAVLLAKWSPDGKHIVTGCRDSRARLWSREGELIRKLEGHQGPVSCAAFSPAGDRCATGSDDGDIRIWNVDGGQDHRLTGHDDAVVSVAFTPDGEHLVSASRDRDVRLWHLTTGVSSPLRGHIRPLSSAAVSPDGKHVIAIAEDGCARLWRIFGNVARFVEGIVGSQLDQVQTACFSPDGRAVLLAIRHSADGHEEFRIDRCNLDQWPDSTALCHGHGDRIVRLRTRNIGPNRDDQHYEILSASQDATARLWSDSGRLVNAYTGHGSWLTDASFSPDGRYVLTACRDTTARVFRRTGQPELVLRGHAGGLFAARFEPGDHGSTRILTASADGTARLWCMSPTPLMTLRAHDGPVYSARYSPDGDRVITTSRDRRALVWNLDGSIAVELIGHDQHVYTGVVAPENDGFLTCSEDGTAKLWDREGLCIHTFNDHGDKVYTAFFSPDGTELLTSSKDRTARLWSRGTKELSQIMTGHKADVVYAAFSGDGLRIATASKDGTAKVWNRDGKALATLTRHRGTVWSAEFSPTENAVVTAGQDMTALVWSLDTDKCIELHGHTAPVLLAMFSPDGQRIATSSRDGTIRIWNRSGDEIATLRGHRGIVWAAMFSPDGHGLVSASQDGTARFWLPRTEDLLDLATQRIEQVRDFSAAERSLYAPLLKTTVR